MRRRLNVNGPADNTREYATAAIIRYAHLGCPTRREYEDTIRRQAYDRLILKNPEQIIRAADKEIETNRALLDDIDAVDKMFRVLRGSLQYKGIERLPSIRNGDDIANAVSFVYFPLCKGVPSHRNIAGRVRAYAVSLPTTERTVYRWLRYARRLFALIRGLTVE